MRSTTLAILAAGAVSAQETMTFFAPYGAEASDMASIAASIVTVEGSHTVLAMSCVSTATPDATITKGSSLAARATSSASSNDDEDSSDAVEGISDYTDSLSDDTSSDEDLESDLSDLESGGCYLPAPLTMTVGSDYLSYSTVVALEYGVSVDLTMAMECTRSDASHGACVQSMAGADAWAEVCQLTVSTDDDFTSCMSANAGKTIPPTTTTLGADDIGSVAIPVTAGADKLSASASASATGSASAKATGSASATASKTGSSKSSEASATGSAPASNGATSVRGGAAFAAAVMGAVVAVLAF